jgi:hypothetical protein
MNIRLSRAVKDVWIAPATRVLDESEASQEVRLLLRDPAGALTLIRKRRRVEEPYRIESTTCGNGEIDP